MKKLLTIVIPAYNMELYLENTLSSLIIEKEEIQQKYEVLIVNDGSKDRTKSIGEEFQNKYEKIFKLINKENGGYGSVINTGVDNAEGKYLKILDGDDWFDSEALEKLIDALDKTDCDMVLTDYTFVYEKTGEKKYWNWSYDCEREFELGNCVSNNNIFWMYGICYKTDLFKNNCIRITEKCFYTDMQFVIYPLCYVRSVIYFHINLYQYRIGREGQSMSYEGTVKHIKEKERMVHELNLFLDQIGIIRNKEIIENIVCKTYLSYVDSLFLVPCTKEHKQMLIDFLKVIKLKYPERYRIIMKKKKILLFELSKYSLYKACCVWHRKIELKQK